MANLSIQDELGKEAEKTNQAFDLIPVARQLLSAEEGKKRAVLEHLGMDHEIKIAAKQQEVKYVREKQTEVLGKATFTGDEIKAICVKYHLRFLPSRYYRGPLDATLAPAILEFTEKHNIATTFMQDRFFIIAPKELFSKDPIPVKKAVSIDPMILYKSDPQAEFYTVVHHWGDGISPYRKILGTMYRTWQSTTAVIGCVAIALWTFLWLYILSTADPVLPIMVGIMCGVLTTFFIIMFKTTDDSGRLRKEYLKYLGGEDNWNSSYQL